MTPATGASKSTSSSDRVAQDTVSVPDVTPTSTLYFTATIAVKKMTITPPFEDIQQKRQTLPYKEWERYSEELAGTQIMAWTGRISKIHPTTDERDLHLIQVYLHSPASLESEQTGLDLLLIFTRRPAQLWAEGQEGEEIVVSGEVSSVHPHIGHISLIDPVVEVVDDSK